MESGGTVPGFPVRAFTVLPVVGLVAWVAVIVGVSAAWATPTDPTPTTNAIVIGGAVYFSLLFGSVVLVMRRVQRGRRHRLFEQLAVVPLEPGALARATRPYVTIGYVYVAFGATSTALALAAVALEGESEQPVEVAVISLTAAWVVFGLYAYVRVLIGADAVVAPLGLTLTEFPTVRIPLYGSATTGSGTLTYEGTRHGRLVAVRHTGDAAVTVVAVDTGRSEVPRTPQQMAVLTGEPVTNWRHVEVRRDGDSVVVARRGRAPARWFLHDLLLAEAVAGDRN